MTTEYQRVRGWIAENARWYGRRGTKRQRAAARRLARQVETLADPARGPAAEFKREVAA